LCHGDFHPGQIMLSGDRYAAFDWSGARRGDPLFDYARTRVLLSMGELPPGTSRALTLLAKVGRRVLLSSYVRAYRRHAAERIDDARVRRWEIVNLAVRMTDEIRGSGPACCSVYGRNSPAVTAGDRIDRAEPDEIVFTSCSESHNRPSTPSAS
jgi:hypothetical protein